MKLYLLTFKWNHRKFGPTYTPIKQQASNLPLGLKRGSQQFLKSITRKERFDVNKGGVKVEIICAGKVEIEGKAAQTESSFSTPLKVRAANPISGACSGDQNM
jgi:hypothetical protein